MLTAEVSAESADAVLELLIRNGVAEDDIMLARLDEIGPIKPGRTAASLIWADIVGQARVNARPVARYLVFMVAAGIILLETRASSVVGVAISITTIPAAAYLGVAAGVRETAKALGALAVLGVNIAVLVLAGTLTLAVQRRLATRRAG